MENPLLPAVDVGAKTFKWRQLEQRFQVRSLVFSHFFDVLRGRPFDHACIREQLLSYSGMSHGILLVSDF